MKLINNSNTFSILTAGRSVESSESDTASEKGTSCSHESDEDEFLEPDYDETSFDERLRADLEEDFSNQESLCLEHVYVKKYYFLPSANLFLLPPFFSTSDGSEKP